MNESVQPKAEDEDDGAAAIARLKAAEEAQSGQDADYYYDGPLSDIPEEGSPLTQNLDK